MAAPKKYEERKSQFMQVPNANIPKYVDQSNTTNNVLPDSTYGQVPDFAGQSNNYLGQLGNAVQDYTKPYDPNKDEVYKNLQKYQESQMMQSAGRRGLAHSDTTRGQIAQANTLLGLEFSQNEMSNRLQNIQNIGGLINTTNNLDDRQMYKQDRTYNRDLQQYGFGLTEQMRQDLGILQTLPRGTIDQYKVNKEDYAEAMKTMDPNSQEYKINNALRVQKVLSDPIKHKDVLVSEYGVSPIQANKLMQDHQDRTLKRDMELYGMNLTDNMRGSLSVLQGLPMEEVSQFRQAEDNYAGAMQGLSPNSREYQVYNALRIQKLLKDPVQYKEYLINDYGLSPLQVDNMVMSKQIEEAKVNVTNEKDAFELEKLKLQVDKAGADLTKAQSDAFMSQIEAMNLPSQIKLEMQRTLSQIASANASVESSKASTRLSDQKLQEQMNKYDPNVQNLFTEWTNSGKEIGEWLNTTDNKGNKIGSSLTLGQLQALAELGKDTGQFKGGESELEKAIADTIRQSLEGGL